MGRKTYFICWIFNWQEETIFNHSQLHFSNKSCATRRWGDTERKYVPAQVTHQSMRVASWCSMDSTPNSQITAFAFTAWTTNYFGVQPYLLKLFTAILVTMYFGLFRIGEVTESDHVVKAKDVQVGTNKNKILFILRTSKTHTAGDKPQKIKINSNDFDATSQRCQNQKQVHTNNALCPFQTLRDYLTVRKKGDNDMEQFFVFSDRSPVKPEHMRRVLCELLLNCGIQCESYGTHSFRAGCSVDLHALGVSLDLICKLGRWWSTSVYTYLKS